MLFLMAFILLLFFVFLNIYCKIIKKNNKKKTELKNSNGLTQAQTQKE